MEKEFLSRKDSFREMICNGAVPMGLFYKYRKTIFRQQIEFSDEIKT